MKFLISNAGNEWGACLSEKCDHRSCAYDRALAASHCPFCDKPLGYCRTLYQDDDGKIYHLKCYKRMIKEIEAMASFRGNHRRKVNKQFKALARTYTQEELAALLFNDPPSKPTLSADPEPVSVAAGELAAPPPLTPQEIAELQTLHARVQSARWRQVMGLPMLPNQAQYLEYGL